MNYFNELRHLADSLGGANPYWCGADVDMLREAAARLAAAEARMVPVHVIFDGPPSHERGRFVEVETPEGKSIRLGQWINRGDGYWALVFNVPIDQTTGYEVKKGWQDEH